MGFNGSKRAGTSFPSRCAMSGIVRAVKPASPAMSVVLRTDEDYVVMSFQIFPFHDMASGTTSGLPPPLG
jgi:hypothetical protein